MKRVALLAMPVAFSAMVSCNNGRSHNPDTTIESSQAGQIGTAPANGASQAVNLENPSTPATASNAGTETVVINPAHGQPGHRCDVAVGAPIPPSLTRPVGGTGGQNLSPFAPQLNLPQTQNNPATAAPTQTVTTVPVQQAPPTTTTSTGGKGLNPEHGKPGHRCDIAVGAPLDSKPVSAAQPGAVTTTPKTATTTPQKVAAGMNPAHGQPGHRCDIAVGAPLNSKPVSATTTTTPQPSPVQPLQVTPLMPPTNAKPDTTKS